MDRCGKQTLNIHPQGQTNKNNVLVVFFAANLSDLSDGKLLDQENDYNMPVEY